jgi:uncharacterized protein (DUF1684 family)
MNFGHRYTRRFAVAALLCAAALPGRGAAAGDAAPIDPAAYQKEIASWRAERVAGLKHENGWLSLIGLFWLEEGENRMGSDPGTRVVLPAGKAPAQVATLVRRGDKVTLQPAPGLTPPLEVEIEARGTTKGAKPRVAPVTAALEVRPDAAKEGATILHLGPLTFWVIARGDKLGVRLKDAQAPAFAAFKGLDDFPVRPDWRVVARFEPYQPPKPIPIANILGQVQDQPALGAVVFERDGKSYRLDALQESEDGKLFIIFADQTNGRETYGAGRFLSTDEVPRDGKVVVDFNKAYNPPCAFSAYATCPLPPRQNRLALRVEAGEKKFGEGHH